MRSMTLLSIALAVTLAACSTTRGMEGPDIAPGLDLPAFAAPQDGSGSGGTGTSETGTDTTTTTTPAPTDTQALPEEIPPLNGLDPLVLENAFDFVLTKGARLISYEDAWTNLKGEREDLPLLELAGKNPWLVMRRVTSIGATEVTPAASGSATEETKSWISQSAEDLVSSYQALNGPGITTEWVAPVSFKTNLFTFPVNDVIATEKLPHSYLADRAFHIVYMREGSPFYPYWIFHGPIDEFRSLVSKLQGRRVLTIGWSMVKQEQ